MKKLFTFCIGLFFITAASAQIEIVKNGMATGRIVVDQGHVVDIQAATLLNDFIRKITGTSLPIVSPGKKQRPGDIVIKSLVSEQRSGIHSKIEEDGFSFSSTGSVFQIYGASGSGTIYGVVALLENYFDVQYFAANACTAPQRQRYGFAGKFAQNGESRFSIPANTVVQHEHRSTL